MHGFIDFGILALVSVVSVRLVKQGKSACVQSNCVLKIVASAFGNIKLLLTYQ